MKVFVGYDTKQDIVYRVCRSSILKNIDAEVIPLKQQDLREQGIYIRDIDPLSSTEFTFTRFLIPHITNYQGWALFVDCDFLFIENIANLFKLAKDEYAVMVVKHNYIPISEIKMHNQKQMLYPRKNWSSLILWNCSHASNRTLTKDIVNSQTGSYLHGFKWLNDCEIGEIDVEWNWLVNWYHNPVNGLPKAIHYTEGGPWLKEYEDCEYANLWIEEYNKLLGKTQ